MLFTQEPTFYYHNSKKINNEMNVVYTRTNILYIHGCHTRTNNKIISVVTHVNPILEIFIIITQRQNSDAKISWEDPCTVAWGHATSSVGGYVGTQKCRIFIHLSLHHSSHFITRLTFHETIFIIKYGFNLIIFQIIYFSIKREFVIKY